LATCLGCGRFADTRDCSLLSTRDDVTVNVERDRRRSVPEKRRNGRRVDSTDERLGCAEVSQRMSD
jgi:hypothetical protein